MSEGGKRIPLRGEIDLLVGGPPCQGFSGMNRYVVAPGVWLVEAAPFHLMASSLSSPAHDAGSRAGRTAS